MPVAAASLKAKQGFTLVHMLVTITVLGLTAGGVAQAILVISRLQARAAQGIARQQDLLATARLFQKSADAITSPKDIRGDGQGFTADCSAKRCEIRIHATANGYELRTTFGAAIVERGVSIRYLANDRGYEVWPGEAPEILRGIALVDPEEAPIAAFEFRSVAPRDCEYDPVIRDCRNTRP